MKFSFVVKTCLAVGVLTFGFYGKANDLKCSAFFSEVASKALLNEFWNEINDLKGLENVKLKLREIQDRIDYNKSNNLNPRTGIDTYIVLDGLPATGKTTLGVLLGKFFAGNGIVSDSRTEKVYGGQLVSSFEGQSKKLVEKYFEAAKTRALFIDEIGGLTSIHNEAIEAFTDQLKANKNKAVVIIADYPQNIDRILKSPIGFSKHFKTRISMRPLSGKEATSMAVNFLKKQGIDTSPVENQIAEAMERFASLPGWASAADVVMFLHSISFQLMQTSRNQESGVDIKIQEVLPSAIAKAIQDTEKSLTRRSPMQEW